MYSGHFSFVDTISEENRNRNYKTCNQYRYIYLQLYEVFVQYCNCLENAPKLGNCIIKTLRKQIEIEIVVIEEMRTNVSVVSA